MKRGEYFKVSGRLMDARGQGPQKTCKVVVERLEPIAAAPLVFADFVNRRATFEGTADAGGILKSGAETAWLDGFAWPPEVEGKNVSVSGAIRRDEAGWRILRPRWKLVDLADQIGAEVLLDGTLWSLNGEWWFEYRGEKLYLTTTRGPVMALDGDHHGQWARVTGKLARQLRPSLSQISIKSDRDLVPCFVVRGARVEFAEQPFSWSDRFGWLYSTCYSVRDGVPELLAESSFRRNILGNETMSRLYLERNYKALCVILRNWTPKTAQVVAGRMDDEKLPQTLRLLYATLLARANDLRGKMFLINAVEARRSNIMLDALYCLGAFPTIAPDLKEIEVRVKWSERTLISIMLDRSAVGEEAQADFLGRSAASLSMADAAAIYSEIPAVLMEINTPAACGALIAYVEANPEKGAAIVRDICWSGATLPVEDLLKLEAVTQAEYARYGILVQLLRQKHRSAGERFYKDVEDYYFEFRNHSCPEVLAAIRSHLDELRDGGLNHARMLLALGEKDPAKAVIAMLDEPTWKDKSLALYELSRLRDARVVGPVARLLCEAADDYLNADSELTATQAVEYALAAIAGAGTKESLHALVDLLRVDLSRFGAYIDREGFRRIIAAHLIELTGESFGLDADAWRNWLETQAEGK
ncbi:MAG TPA: hypothetical protein VN699_15850 [Pirellulales bacterium]|nr:hypothetical protein [Pirellulales bacterium]